MLRKNGFLAKKSGQLPTFENKSGQRILRKNGEKGAKKAIFGVFLVVFGQKMRLFITCGQKPTFYSYLIVSKKFNNI